MKYLIQCRIAQLPAVSIELPAAMVIVMPIFLCQYLRRNNSGICPENSLDAFGKIAEIKNIM